MRWKVPVDSAVNEYPKILGCKLTGRLLYTSCGQGGTLGTHTTCWEFLAQPQEFVTTGSRVPAKGTGSQVGVTIIRHREPGERDHYKAAIH